MEHPKDFKLYQSIAQNLLSGSRKQRMNILSEYFTEFELTGKIIHPDKSMPILEKVDFYNKQVATTGLRSEFFFIVPYEGKLFAAWSWDEKRYDGVPFVFRNSHIRNIFLKRYQNEIQEYFNEGLKS